VAYNLSLISNYSKSQIIITKHTYSSSQEALLENLKGQNTQLQADFENLALKMCESKHKLEKKKTTVVIEQVKVVNRE
jgi:glucokinase